MKSGDIGEMRSDGTLRIVDRIKHIFKLAQVSAFLVFPKLKNGTDFPPGELRRQYDEAFISVNFLFIFLIKMTTNLLLTISSRLVYLAVQ